jgi:hypothetical protein
MPLYFTSEEALSNDENEAILHYGPGYTQDYRSEDEPDVLRSMVVGTRYNFLTQDGPPATTRI